MNPGESRRRTKVNWSASAVSKNDSVVEQGLPEVLLEYGIAMEQVGRIERLPQRVKNVNFRIRTDSGSWILKCHAAAAAKNLRFSHELELLLTEAEFPVARLQKSRSGETLVHFGGTYFTLHAWVEGAQFQISQLERVFEGHPNLVRELGSAVGILHRIGEQLVEPGKVDVRQLLAGPNRTVSSIRRGLPPQMFGALRLRLRPMKSEFDSWILAKLPELYEQAGELAASTLGTHGLSADIVVGHNDLNWENLIFGPSMELLAMLDFDNAAHLPRALDVGAAAAVLAGGSGCRLEEFLDSYSQTAGHEVGHDLVDLGIRWKCVRSMLWSINAYLNGRVADPAFVATWCLYLDGCLQANHQRHSTT